MTQVVVDYYDLLPNLKVFFWTQNCISKVPLDFGSLRDECHILATYCRVWVTLKAV